MTKERQAEFDAMVASWNLTKDQKEAMENFVDEVSSDAYEKGANAQAYADAMSYLG